MRAQRKGRNPRNGFWTSTRAWARSAENGLTASQHLTPPK